MSLNSRLKKLEQAVGKAAKGRGRSICSRLCTGASWERVLQMIEESLLPESVSVLKNIDDQIEEYSRRPPRKLPNGEMTQDIHGFVYWLWDLQEGNSSLPEKIPPELLLAWRNGYINHPAGVTPVPIRRCEDCLLVLPNSSPDGFGPSINPCPACDSENVSHKKLSGPEPMHIYTPVDSCGGRWPRNACQRGTVGNGPKRLAGCRLIFRGLETSPTWNGDFSMSLNSRLKKLEQAVGAAPCPICRDWWKGPIVMRNETDPPAHRDPEVCPSCGRKRPEGLILEIVICEQVVPPRPFIEEF